MSAAVQMLESDAQVRAAMRAIGAEARLAARILANAPAEQKNHALACGARNLRAKLSRYPCRQRAGSGRRRGEGFDGRLS